MKNFGAGWIVYEESHRKGSRKLVSVIPARRSAKWVTDFMQQIYADRSYSVQERLEIKKSPKFAPYKVMRGSYPTPLHIGHEPFLVGIKANTIRLQNNRLTFSYKILVNVDGKFNPTFEGRQLSIEVDG